MKPWEQKVRNEIKNVNYYVYEHYLDNELFYIGKGSGERCFTYNSRSQAWKNLVNNREKEIVVKIKKTFENENEALIFEKYIINEMSKKYELTNIVYNSEFKKHEEYAVKSNITTSKPIFNRSIKKNVSQEIKSLENLIIDLNNYNSNINAFEYPNSTLNEKSNMNIEVIQEKVDNLRKIHPNDTVYLSEIIKKENLKFKSNNLILAPAGSGKTTLIKKLIGSKTDKVLIIISNDILKDSTAYNYNQIKEEKIYAVANDTTYKKDTCEINVMSYAEFGNKVRFNDDFIGDIKQVFCEEIHSLLIHQQTSDSSALSHAIKTLFTKHEGTEIFYFTATDEYLSRMEVKFPGVLRNVTMFDYRKHPKIKQYIPLSEYEFSHIEQIRPHLKACSRIFDYFGYKALAFSRTIAGQKRIAEIAEEEGFNPLVLWSINNADKEMKMTDEQLHAREYLLTNGEIPAPYDFLIINSAMQEGWDLYDSKIKLAIMNTTNETEKIQAVGRLRNDIDILVYKVKSRKINHADIEIPDEYLDIPLTSKRRRELCEKLNIINYEGVASKWRIINSLLDNDSSGYQVLNHTKNIDGKRARVTTISIKEDTE